MANLTVRRSSAKQVIAPLALYITGCLIVGLVAATFGDSWLPTLFLLGAITSLLVWHSMHWSDQWARYLSFGALLLLVGALNRVLYIADYLFAGARFNEWPFYVESPQLAVFKGEVITVLGTLATVLFWKLSGGAKISPMMVMRDAGTTYRILLVSYLIALIAMLMSKLLPAAAAEFGQLLPSLLGLGLVSAYLIPATKLRNSLSRLLLVSLLSVPFIILASGSGMKENIILALLPSVISAWQCFRNPIVRALMIGIGLLALGLITAYVNFYRAELWQASSRPQKEAVLQDFMDELGRDGISKTASGSFPEFIERNNASVHRGWAVSIADERSHYPELVFAPMLYVFIPRAIWPEKPIIRQGWEYSGVVFGEEYIAWSGSSTAAGLYPSLYLGGGWIGVIFGAILIGFLLGKMSLVALKFGGPTAAGLYVFSMLPFILRLDETWTVGAISGPVVGCAYVLLIVTVAKSIATVIPRPFIPSSR